MCPDALFLEHLAAQDASQATFDYLNTRRVVNRGARDFVDDRFGDAVWRAPWLQRAHEFCNDLAPGALLVPGTPPNAAIERMIHDNQMAELVVGMDEFKMDATTQQVCIQQLQTMLLAPLMLGVHNPHQMQAAATLHNARQTPGLFRSIIGAVRAHPTNMTIQLDGVTLCCGLMPSHTAAHYTPYVTRPLADYTIATLIASVEHHRDTMGLPALADICLTTLCRLVDMHSADSNVADPPFLMSGAHSIPGFVMTLMHINRNKDAMTVWRSVRLLRKLLIDAELPLNRAGLLACDIGQIEDQILAGMPSRIPFAQTENQCLEVLICIYQKFPLRVRRPTDVMACALQTLAAHSDNVDVRDSVFVLANAVVSVFWSRASPARVLADGQVRPSVMAMMPLVSSCFRVADESDHMGKWNCSMLFNIISALCEDNPQQIALINDMNNVPLLQRKFSPPVAIDVDGIWQAASDRLTAILTPP